LIYLIASVIRGDRAYALKRFGAQTGGVIMDLEKDPKKTAIAYAMPW